MNADEIVRALRKTCESCNPTPCCEFEALGPAAADLIESLQAQVDAAYMDGVKKAIYEIMKEADIPGSNEIINSGDSDDGMCAQVAKRINAQLAASQRRADAAVEDMMHIASEIDKCDWVLKKDGEKVSSLHLGRCDVCSHTCCDDGCKFEWRGPQDEKGDDRET